MNFLKTSLILAALGVGALAETPVTASKKEISLDHLLSERDSLEAFEKAAAEARENHVGEQAILEARFLYHVDRREDAAIAALLPDFNKRTELFKIEDSAIFAVKEDWLAVREYVEAMACLKNGDKDGFKKHITEAFWLSPRQASAFAPHIERVRLQDAMSQVKIDFGVTLPSMVSGAAPVSLQSLMVEKKAMLLHFWSPVSRECESSLPDYMITAKTLGEKGISMVSILTEATEEALTSARAMTAPLSPQGAWLIESEGDSLARMLRIQLLPAMVLVSQKGEILFNGEPGDDALWEALKQFDVSLVRPEIQHTGE